jgi:predicted dithiol-disulfide oxidoreductase (DUF899 family)
VVYQFMNNGPDDHCPGCSAYTDNTDTAPCRIDLHRRQTSYMTISDMPLAQITGYRQRKGWTVPFYPSRGTTFSQPGDAVCPLDGDLWLGGLKQQPGGMIFS